MFLSLFTFKHILSQVIVAKNSLRDGTIVHGKRSLEIAPIYLLICVNKDSSTAVALICRFGKELFEVHRKFNGAPGAAEAAAFWWPERNYSPPE